MIDERPITHPTMRGTDPVSDRASDTDIEPESAAAGSRPRMFATVALALAALGAAALGAIESGDVMGWAALGVVLAWCAAACVLAVRRAGERIGFVAVLVPAAIAAIALADAYGNELARGVAIGALLAVGGGLLTLAPNGGFVSSSQRTAGAVVAVIGAVTAFALAISAPDLPPAVVWLASLAVGAIAAGSATAACKEVSPIDRARLQWIGWGITVGAVAAVAALGLYAVTGRPDPIAPAVVAAGALPAIGLGATAYRRALGVIGAVLVHTIVAVGLLAFVAAVYLVVVVGLSGMPDESERTVLALSIVAALVIAITGLPIQRKLHAMASRRVYGDDDPPDHALEKFTTRMSRAIPMDELLLQLVESIRKTMKTTSAEVWTGSDGRYELAVSVPHQERVRLELEPESLSVASRAHVQGNAWLSVWMPELLDGRDDRAVRFTSVSHLGELLGFIVTERPAAAVALDEEDEHRVLVDIARQLGLALHNVRLDNALQASLDDLREANEELVASRARIVAATDESRRRIERDLHDGAQQHLVALAVKVGLIRQLLDVDRDTATAMLDELREDVQATLTELRELAHGIYPPRLRDRGLADALTAAAGRSPLPTTVHTEGLGRYGPDIETAVYFCCLEAIQNAGKHAGEGATIVIEIFEREGTLRFTVADDGAGFDPASCSDSHGFVNMRDRLGAFAGVLEIESAPGAGTTVRGSVPLA